MHNGRRLSYITWSPSRWSTLDQAAITNRSQPTSITTDAGSKRPTIDSKDHDNRLTIVSRYAAHFDVAAGRETPQWVGWTGLDGRVSPPKLLLNGFEYRQTNVKYLGKIAIVIVTRWLIKHKWYWFWVKHRSIIDIKLWYSWKNMQCCHCQQAKLMINNTQT